MFYSDEYYEILKLYYIDIDIISKIIITMLVTTRAHNNIIRIL